MEAFPQYQAMSFFRKITPHKHSPKGNISNGSPPMSQLPPPPADQIKDEQHSFRKLSGNSIKPSVNALKEGFKRVNEDVKQLTNQKNENTEVGSNKRPPLNTSDSKQQETVFNAAINKPSNVSIHSEKGEVIVETKTPWKKKKLYNSPFPRFGHAVSSYTAPNGSIYLMGGLSGNAVFGDMWVLEPIRDNHDSNSKDSENSPYIASPIENPQKVPSPRTGHASILIGNAFIIFGGDTAINNEPSLDNKLYFFNITSLKWTINDPMGEKPCGRYGTQISVLNVESANHQWCSQLYVFGGELNEVFFNDLWRYDLSRFRDPKNRWIRLEPHGDIPPPLANHTVTAYDGKLFVFGGKNMNAVSDKLYCYDPYTNRWSLCRLKGINLPPALHSHSATVYGSLLFIFGGKQINDRNSGDLYVIDLTNMNSWKLFSDLPYSPGARYGHSISANVKDAKLVIMGGDVYDNDFDGIEDTSINLIDESKFALTSSVVFECDIHLVQRFIEKQVLNDTRQEVKNIESPTAKFPTEYKQEVLKQSRNNSFIDLVESPAANGIPSSTPINSDEEIDENNSTNNKTIENSVTTPLNVSSEKNGDDITLETIDRVTIPVAQGRTINPAHMQSDAFADDVSPSSSSKEKNQAKKSNVSLGSNQIRDSHDSLPKTLKTPDQQIDSSPSFSTPSIQQHAALPFSPAVVEKDNLKIQKLVKMVNDIKSEMKRSVNNANSQIVKLESEKAQLLEQLKKREMGDSLSKPAISENADVSNNLLNGDTTLQKSLEYEKFINDELSTIPLMSRLIEDQKNKISNLESRLHDDEDLKEKVLKLEAENLSLRSKIENLMAINGASEVSKVPPIESLTAKINELSIKWSKVGPHVESKVSEDLHKYKAMSESLTKQLEESLEKQKELEHLYNQSKNSIQLSHKAMLLAQSESSNLKNELKNVKNELEDLKMKRRVFSASSGRLQSSASRIPSSSSVVGHLSGPKNQDVSNMQDKLDGSIDNSKSVDPESQSLNGEESGYEGRNVDLSDERYQFKIRDLEANLFIVSQERDQIKKELISLKKELYNTSHDTSMYSSV